MLISTVVMFQAQNGETINSTWKVVVSFKILWRQAWQDCVSQHITRPARPRPWFARSRSRPIFWPVLS